MNYIFIHQYFYNMMEKGLLVMVVSCTIPNVVELQLIILDSICANKTDHSVYAGIYVVSFYECLCMENIYVHLSSLESYNIFNFSLVELHLFSKHYTWIE